MAPSSEKSIRARLLAVALVRFALAFRESMTSRTFCLELPRMSTPSVTATAGVARLKPFDIRGEMSLGAIWMDPIASALDDQYGGGALQALGVGFHPPEGDALELLLGHAPRQTIEVQALPHRGVDTVGVRKSPEETMAEREV